VHRADRTGKDKWILVRDAFVYGFMCRRRLKDELLEGKMEEVVLV
jgi:hypothetical protein